MMPPERNRWASLPASGHQLTDDQCVIVNRMIANARRASEKMRDRWAVEHADNQGAR
jgi:hypothetical protein